MNFKKFKLLTADEKQEYMFEFHDKPKLSSKGITGFLVVLLSLMNVYAVTTYASITSNVLTEYQHLFIEGFTAMLKIVQAGTFVLILYVIIDIVCIVRHYYKEKKWLEQINFDDKVL